MYKAKLYFSDTSEQTREAAISRSVDLITDASFNGATITRTVGVWNGVTEPGFTLEIVHSFKTILEPSVQVIARRLAFEYEQKSVLVTIETIISAVLVSSDGNCESLQ